MTYMDEWEYHLWIEMRRSKNGTLLQADQTSSGEVMTEKGKTSQPLDRSEDMEADQ